MKRRPYAGEVSKEYLEKLGIEYVSKDGTTIIKNGKLSKIYVSKKAKRPYGRINVYDADLRAATPVEERTQNTGEFTMGVHVINYVWNTGNTKPAGMVIDHIDNDPLNNDISNLQMITQGENIAKERDNWHVFELKCNLSKPRSFYEDKLAHYVALHEQAKKDNDKRAAHHLRSNISGTRARLRYYDSHIDEYLKEKEVAEHECHARADKRRELQARVDSARKYWKEALEAYGKDDSYVQKLWGEWKLAIAMLNAYKGETRINKIS